MDVPATIRELKKIEMIRCMNGVYRLDHALTATQKTILGAFGIGQGYIKGWIKALSERLNMVEERQGA